jgi:hypothetical protein
MRSRDTKKRPRSQKKKEFHKNKQINKLSERLEEPSRKGQSFYSSLRSNSRIETVSRLSGLNRRNNHIISINIVAILLISALAY